MEKIWAMTLMAMYAVLALEVESSTTFARRQIGYRRDP